MNTKKTTDGAEGPPQTTADATANVAVESLVNGLKIGKAIVARGRVDFPVTEETAKQLESLGKVRIVGLWTCDPHLIDRTNQ